VEECEILLTVALKTNFNSHCESVLKKLIIKIPCFLPEEKRAKIVNKNENTMISLKMNALNVLQDLPGIKK
jgi:hypothetical protein